MKKSECYRWAQEAVIEDQVITTKEKIEILRRLIMDEDIAKLLEEKSNETEAAEDVALEREES